MGFEFVVNRIVRSDYGTDPWLIRYHDRFAESENHQEKLDLVSAMNLRCNVLDAYMDGLIAQPSHATSLQIDQMAAKRRFQEVSK